MLRARVTALVAVDVAQVEGLPGEDAPTAAGAEDHNGSAVDEEPVTLAQASVMGAVASGLAGLRRPLRPHRRRWTVLEAVGTPARLGEPTATPTGTLVHRSANRGEKSHCAGVPGEVEFTMKSVPPPPVLLRNTSLTCAPPPERGQIRRILRDTKTVAVNRGYDHPQGLCRGAKRETGRLGQSAYSSGRRVDGGGT
jgi:hypothetical protein